MPEIKSYNNSHPELRKGERFCTNATLDDLDANPQWRSLPFRVGKKAYDIYGNPLFDMVPVFKRLELKDVFKTDWRLSSE